MILELDCGNSLIKWRIIDHTKQIVTRGIAKHIHQLLADIDSNASNISFCRIVSVRSEQETKPLLDLLRSRYSVVRQAVSNPEYLGVKNGYTDFTRLGPDRWAAIVAAYQQNKQASLILSFGTAVTSDFINAQGQHLGGFITPGLLLMRQQLLANTGRIHYHENMANDILTTIIKPGSSTEDAVNSGCYLMLHSFINQQLQLAEDYLGEDFVIYATGGDASLFSIPRANYLPDLVFNGLALLCPAVDN